MAVAVGRREIRCPGGGVALRLGKVRDVPWERRPGGRRLVSIAGVAELCYRPAAALSPRDTAPVHQSPAVDHLVLPLGRMVVAVIVFTLRVGQDGRGGALALGGQARLGKVSPLRMAGKGLQDSLPLQRGVGLAGRSTQAVPVLRMGRGERLVKQKAAQMHRTILNISVSRV